MRRKRKKTGTQGDADLICVTGDQHCNSERGLRPPRFYDKERQEYRHAPRRVVEDLWEPWLQHADDLRAEKERLKAEGYNARVIVAHLGDGVDRNKYDPEGYEMLSANRTVITDIGEAALEPLLADDLVDLFIFERGTSGHEGGSGELCEMLAERISRRANVWRANERDTWSHYCGRFSFQGVDVVFSHHPISRARRFWTRGNAANRTALHYWMAYNIPLVMRNKVVNQREPTPDLMFFGHCHFDAMGGGTSTIPLVAVYIPSWQLPYAYIHGLGAGIVPNPVGCKWMRCQGGRYHLYKTWLHTPRAQGAVRV